MTLDSCSCLFEIRDKLFLVDLLPTLKNNTMASVVFGNVKTFGVICLLLASMSVSSVDAGLGFGAICSAGCAAMVVACYSAGGAVFGTITAGVGQALHFGVQFSVWNMHW
ncbi:hypothetical protein Ocin01_08216 [Orchesella cincta]|uniref:Uncharacterized protein n=1 Tax=Orchesella cincta TaxID=48709 RepID=A0A1D2MZI9_ORCCI|nr:hypothetical protein Ocin01_08216 [Orchesella cincta]